MIMEEKKYSYVSLLTDDSYVYGIMLLVESMKQVNTKYPLHILVTNNVSASVIEILNQIDVTYEIVDTISMPKQIYDFNMSINPKITAVWKNCLTKFKIFNLTQFDKIVFLDADIMILKNLDHLFEKPHMTSALDGEYFNIWPDWDHFNSGILVIEPSEQLFNDILQFINNFIPEFKKETPLLVYADQEILNLYYSDWPERKELHLNKYYDVFPPYIQTEQLEDLKENCYFIHYVGRKPWTNWFKADIEQYDEYFYTEGKNIIENYSKKLNWEKVKNKLIITVYAICKNEENNVDKWLKSFSEADYICILDTGSTDTTWEKLQNAQKKYSNLIIKQQQIIPWRFDEARNQNLAMIPKETDIFFMADLDEIIKESGWAQKLREAWTPTFSRAEFTYNRDVGPNDVVERSIKEYRIHSKQWHKYVNIVHEALINEAGEKRFFRDFTTPVDITVWHYPDLSKNRNYAELCEEELNIHPEDSLMRLQLAIEYEILQDFQKAQNHFSYLISNPNKLQDFEQARCYYGIGSILINQGRMVEGLWFFAEGRLICPYFFDNYFAPALVYINTNENEKSIEILKLAFTQCREAFWCSINDINSYVPYFMLGLNYLNQNKLIEAIAYFKIAEALNEQNADIKQYLNTTIQKFLNNYRV